MQIRIISQDFLKCFVNNWTIHPPIYPLCPVHQLLEVDKGQCTATRTRWRHHLDHILHTLYHVRPKKAFEPSTIRTVLNDCSDMHVIVVWIVSGMKELLHFPKQLLPMAIHQSVWHSTRPHPVAYVRSSLDVTCHASEVQYQWIIGEESLYSWIICFGNFETQPLTTQTSASCDSSTGATKSI